MAWFIGQSILMIALAFLLGLLVGWLIWGRLLRRTEQVAATESAPAATAAIPEQRTSPEDSADDAEVSVAEPVAVATEPEPEPAVATVVEPEPEPEPAVATVAEPESEPVAAVAVMAKPRSKKKAAVAAQPDEVEPDDLERIEGIGPAMSRALVAAGVRTYAQLAEADEDALRDAIQAKGLKFAPSLVTWSRQARLLADGDEEGFAELTRRLVAGRDEGRE